MDENTKIILWAGPTFFSIILVFSVYAAYFINQSYPGHWPVILLILVIVNIVGAIWVFGTLNKWKKEEERLYRPPPEQVERMMRLEKAANEIILEQLKNSIILINKVDRAAKEQLEWWERLIRADKNNDLFGVEDMVNDRFKTMQQNRAMGLDQLKLNREREERWRARDPCLMDWDADAEREKYVKVPTSSLGSYSLTDVERAKIIKLRDQRKELENAIAKIEKDISAFQKIREGDKKTLYSMYEQAKQDFAPENVAAEKKKMLEGLIAKAAEVGFSKENLGIKDDGDKE